MARKPYVGGNWKMNMHHKDAIDLAKGLCEQVTATDAVDVTIFVPFPYLAAVGQVLCDAGSGIKLGAQDFYTQPNGAFTGEVSLSQLKDVGVKSVLVGHSERRHVIGECDVLLNDKVLAALEADLEVVLCVGEKIEQREAGKTDFINFGQMCYGLAGVSAEQMAKITIAYEPVWAIGTGKTASPEDAQQAHAAIRGCLSSIYNNGVAEATRIQYGGSMKPGNAKELIGQADIDGGLIGGASLKAEDFAGIVSAAV